MSIKRFLILAVIIIVVIMIVLKYSEKRPMSGETFISVMEKQGYQVIDNIHIKETDMLYESRLPSFEVGLDPIEHYSATNISRSTELVYRIYPNEESAVKLFNLVKNNQKLDVTRDQKVGDFGVEKNSKDVSNRSGNNYQRYYAKEFEDRYFLISRIDNTILLASIDSNDSSDINQLLNGIGY